MEYFFYEKRKERKGKERREITAARWLLQRHLDARLAITFLHALPPPTFPSTTFFSPTTSSPTLLSNDVTSLVSPGAEVCSDREDTGARRQISFEFPGEAGSKTREVRQPGR